jgi:hypothetical protein
LKRQTVAKLRRRCDEAARCLSVIEHSITVGRIDVAKAPSAERRPCSTISKIAAALFGERSRLFQKRLLKIRERVADVDLHAVKAREPIRAKRIGVHRRSKIRGRLTYGGFEKSLLEVV